MSLQGFELGCGRGGDDFSLDVVLDQVGGEGE